MRGKHFKHVYPTSTRSYTRNARADSVYDCFSSFSVHFPADLVGTFSTTSTGVVIFTVIRPDASKSLSRLSHSGCALGVRPGRYTTRPSPPHDHVSSRRGDINRQIRSVRLVGRVDNSVWTTTYAGKLIAVRAWARARGGGRSCVRVCLRVCLSPAAAAYGVFWK